MRILQWNENVSGIADMSVQHLSEIESSKRDPRLSFIERIADAMELAVMLVPEHMAPDIRRYIASQGRVFTTTQSPKETSRTHHTDQQDQHQRCSRRTRRDLCRCERPID